VKDKGGAANPGNSNLPWLILAATFLALFWYILAFGRELPIYDWWMMLPWYSGVEPVTPGWLWEQDQESRLPMPRLAGVGQEARLPIPRLLDMALWRTFGSMRPTLFLSVFLLGAAALILLMAVRKARGRSKPGDAVIPLLLLNLGHYEVVSLSYYMHFALSVFLMSVFLGGVISSRKAGPIMALSAGAAVFLLPLSGPVGEAVAIPLALWVIAYGLFNSTGRPVDGKWGTPVAVAGIAGLTACGAYFIGYRAPVYVPPPPGITAIFRISLQFISMSLGPFGKNEWYIAIPLILFISATSLFALRKDWVSKIPDRWRTAGLAAFFAAMTLMIISIGWGRAGWAEDAGFRHRYTTIGAPILLAAYLALESGASAALRTLARTVLIAVAVSAYFLSIPAGLDFGRMRQAMFDSVRSDIVSGLTSREMATKWWPSFYYGEPGAYSGLELMRKSGIGPYQGLPAAGLNRINEHRGTGTTALAFSSSGILAAGREDGGLVLFGTDGRPGPPALLHTGEISSLVFGPGGKSLVSGSWDGCVRTWSVSGRRLMPESLRERSERMRTALSPDGKMLALGRDDGLVRLLDSASGKENSRLAGHDGEIRAMAYSPNGKLLATTGWDRSIRIWDTGTGRNTATLRGHADVVCAVLFTPDGKTLATASFDGTMRLWDPYGREQSRIYAGKWGKPCSAAFSPDGTILAVGDPDGTVTIWDRRQWKVLAAFRAHETAINCLSFSNNGKLLASGPRRGPVRIWRVGAILRESARKAGGN